VGTQVAGEPRAWHEELGYLLEVVALTSFVVAQPVLDVFGNAPQVFLQAGAERDDVVRFAVAVVAIPPLVVGAALALTRLGGRRLRALAQTVAVAVLTGVLGVYVSKRLTDWRGFTLVAIGAVVGALAAVLYRRAAFRSFLRYAAVAPLIFLVSFLLFSPVSALVRKGDTVEPTDLGLAQPVVWLMLDELPTASLLDESGRIDASRYPAFARLAATSTWYRDNTTVAELTQLAVPAALTGRVPEPDNDIPAVWSEYADNVFTLLGGSYEMNVVESATRLCPDTICDPRDTSTNAMRDLLRLARETWPDIVGPRDAPGFALADADLQIPGGEVSVPADDDDRGFAPTPVRLPAYDEWLRRIHAGPEPGFSFFHLELPHSPWRVHADGTEYAFILDLPGHRDRSIWSADWPARAARQRHLIQLRYVDSMLGDLLDRLDETGLTDDALLAVTADHGIAFTTGEPMRGTDSANIGEIMWSPLFVRAPDGPRGEIDDRNAQIIDVVPTIADALGVQVTWEADGRSLLGEPRTGDERPLARAHDDLLQPADDALLTVDGSAWSRRVLHEGPALDPAISDFEHAVLASSPSADLLGRSVDTLPRGEPAGISASIELRDVFDAVDLRVPPSHVIGQLSAVPPAPTVVVALNGTIAGTSEVFDDWRGSHRITTLLRHEYFRSGSNTIELFVLDGATLRPIDLAD
jgi:hypothetical protein